MSPEQASGDVADSRSDQFSFGLVLYELLTRHRAFVRPTAAETLGAIIRDDPPPIDVPNAAIPTPVRWIVERCLAKAPEDRYASTRDLARDLASVRDNFADLTTAAAATPRAVTGRRRELMAWVSAALLGAAVIGLVLWHASAPPMNPGRPIRFSVAPPPNASFYMTIASPPFAMSPDGRHLAFIGTADGQRQVWLRSFDSLESRPLPGTEGGSGAFWSPDGLSLGFFAHNKLKRVPISGGDVVTICEAGSGGGATWNRDDVILFAPSVETSLSRVSANGGTATPVTTLDAAHEEALHTSPVFLPDGHHFVFTVVGRDNSGLHLGSLDSADRKRLLPDVLPVGFSDPDRLFFVRNRNLMAQPIDLARFEPVGDPVVVAEGVAITGPSAAAAVSARGDVVYWSGSQNITQLTWVRRDGTAVGTVGPPGAYMNIALSPDGRQVAVDRFDTEPSVWLIDVGRGTMTRATFGHTYESTPVWAPDSRSFAFASARETPPNVFLKRLDTAGDDQRLFRSTVQSFPQSWSRDGLIAYVTVDPKTHGDIWLLPASGQQKPWPVVQTPAGEVRPRISPDGRWLAYESNETGGFAVYVTRFPQPGAKWRISIRNGGFPVWRADSRELFYRAGNGMLMAVAVGAGSDFEAGVPTPLFDPKAIPGNLGLGTFYDVAADGRFLVNRFVERTSPPATVVLNWAPAATGRTQKQR